MQPFGAGTNKQESSTDLAVARSCKTTEPNLLTYMELIPKDVEQIVMGQILLDHKVMATAAQLLRAEHFGDDECREAYEACLSVWRSGGAVDLLTIAVHLQREQSAGISETMARMVGWTMRVS